MPGLVDAGGHRAHQDDDAEGEEHGPGYVFPVKGLPGLAERAQAEVGWRVVEVR